MKNIEGGITRYKLAEESNPGIIIRPIQQIDPTSDSIQKPHRDDHFLLVFALKGEFILKIDFEDMSLHGPFILSIAPDQVHQTIAIHQGEGFVVGIEEYIIEREFHNLLEHKLSIPISVEQDDQQFSMVIEILKIAFKIQTQTENIYLGKAIQCLTDSIFCLLVSRIEAPRTAISNHEKRGYIIEQTFKQLLKENFTEWKRPSQYATALSISISHLNDTIKELTGMAVSKHIQVRNMVEAKRLLYFTDLEIREICYKLGYEDPVYFGKLFKKLTKMTPLQFRIQFRD